MADLRALALTAAAAVALSSAASAADLLPPPPAFEPPPPIAAPEMGGWYIRGDVGMGVQGATNFNSNAGVFTGYTDEFYNGNVSESGLFDVGVGYQVNNWFRTDVTGELRGGAHFSGLEVSNATSAASVVTPPGYSQFADNYRGDISSTLLMWNAYVDMGTWYGLTPWAGAGVGVAFNKFSGGSDAGFNTPYNGGNGAAGVPNGGVFSNGVTTNLAWALMAGVDFNVTHQLKLELGYRYLNYGTFKSGVSHCIGGNSTAGSMPQAFNCGGNSFNIASRSLASNDFRIGLRYYLDSTPPAPAPMDAPIVRKY